MWADEPFSHCEEHAEEGAKMSKGYSFLLTFYYFDFILNDKYAVSLVSEGFELEKNVY